MNGWDNVDDNNSGKTFLGGIGITPAEILSMYFSGTYGPEQTDNGHSKRGAVTGVFTVKPADLVTLVLEGTYGNETDLVGANQNKSALWYGTAGYVIVKPADAWTLALRGEVFVDSDGVRFASAQAPNGSTAWAITPTVAFQVTEGLMWRNEYRHDENNHKVFENNSRRVLARSGYDRERAHLQLLIVGGTRRQVPTRLRRDTPASTFAGVSAFGAGSMQRGTRRG